MAMMENTTDVFQLEELVRTYATRPPLPPQPTQYLPTHQALPTPEMPTFQTMNRTSSISSTAPPVLIVQRARIPLLPDYMQDPRMEVLIVKSICLSILWISAFTLCCIPLCVSKVLSRSRWWKDRQKRILGALNYTSGGVFLATIFLDLLPDLEKSFQKAFKVNGIESNYPFPEFTVLCGMILFIFLEQMVISCTRRCFGTDDVIEMVFDEGKGHGHSVPCGNHAHSVKCSFYVDEMDRYDDMINDGATESLLLNEDSIRVANLTDRKKDHDDDEFHDSGCYQNSTEVIGKSPPKTIRRISRDHSTSARMATILRSFCLMFALSLHSVFEGLVLGFQTDLATVWKLFFALLVHKSLVAFSLGSKFATVIGTVSMRSIIGMTFIFSLAAPSGGAVSTAIGEGYQTDKSPSFQLVVCLSSAVASGSFLFVTFFEILRAEGSHIGFLNACFLTLGFLVTAMI